MGCKMHPPVASPGQDPGFLKFEKEQMECKEELKELLSRFPLFAYLPRLETGDLWETNGLCRICKRAPFGIQMALV